MKRLIGSNNEDYKKKLQEYNRIVDRVMANDSNSSADTLLEEAGSLDYAIYLLKLGMDHVIEDQQVEGEEKQFYVDIRNNLLNILSDEYK